jgi:hypothetical protein
MVRIEMTQDEARMLRKLLESHLSELRTEMAATSIEDFVEALRREEGLIENLLQHLEGQDLSYPESMFGEYA